MRKISSLIAAVAVAAAIVSLPGRSAAAAGPVAAAPVAAVAPVTASAPAVAPAALPVGSSTGLSDAFGNSALSLLQNLLCPVVTGVADATHPVPVVGPIVDALPAIICSIGVLGYVYKTTYIPASGPPVVRYTKALVGVPTLLDVDGAGLLPDFYGTLTANLPPNGLNLQIQRQLGFPINAKVSIEAIALLPTSGTPTFVGFGEDGTTGGTAGRWVAKASILGISASTIDLGLDLTATNPPFALATMGEMFSGDNPDAPTTTYRGNAKFAPVPAAFKTRLKMASDRQQVSVNTTPTRLDAKVDILTPGNHEQNITAAVDQVPSSIDVVHSSGPGDSSTVTYDASAPIAKVEGAYRDKVGGNIQTAAALDAWGVPAHIRFDQTGENTFVGATQGGKFDRIQARFAKSGDVGALDPSTSAFAKFHRTTTTAFAGSLQLNDLQSVQLDQSGPITGEVKFATAPALIPITVDDDVTTVHLDGFLKGLPADTTISIDSDAGEIVFDGHGTGIQEIFLHGTKSTPFFARAKRVDVDVKDLPAVMTVDYAQTNGGVTFTASGNGIGSVELLASNGAGIPATPAGDYASYEDTPTLYRAYARILGIKEVSFSADPMSGTIKTTSPQVMNLYANLADATHNLKVNSTIDKVPSWIDFSMDQPTNKTTVLEYDSHGQNIDQVTADATGLYNLADGTALPLGIDTLHAQVEDIPSHMRAVFSSANGTSFTFAPRGQNDQPNNQKIGRILLQLYPSANGPHNSIAGHQTAYGNLQTGRFTADIHDIGDTFFQITTAGQNMGYSIASDPLDYEFVQADGKYLKGQISNPTPATINLDMTNKVHVHYRAKTDTQIDSITLKTDMAGGYIDVNLQNIAPDVDVCFSGDNKACKPSFVPNTFGGFSMPPALLDFSLIPSNLAGAAWPTRFRVDGTYCFDESDAATCLDGSNKKSRLVISNLRFGKVQVGAGFQSFDCTACTAGRAYAYFDTDNTLISGDVKYYQDDADDPLIHYHTDSDASGIEAQNKILFADYCLPTCIDYDDLTLLHSGTFSCIDHPHLDIDIPVFDDIDILSGSFIHFC
jgi:hypothetical protein